ncbi:hypothetical protein ACP4OV_029926 [Aristida adscensionis]
MVASKVAVNRETGDTTVAATAGGGPFEPCVWGDFFVTYTPPPSTMSEECMRERADQLKKEVRGMFELGKAMSMAETVSLVDTVERLGIDNHFREEIDEALGRIHGEELESGSSNDLHPVALRFCLLRQHGFRVSTDVFDKFRDPHTGSFSPELSNDPRALLSLYNAAHMAAPGEAVLDDAISFSRRHLEAGKRKLKSPMAEQVSRSLDIPRPRFMRRLEALHYIVEYEQEEAHDAVVLELARLDFSLVRSTHLKELRALSLWWRDLYDGVKLSYARDRIVEPYFYTLGVFHEEENSHVREIVTKVFALLGLLDDTFDVHATFEECQMLDEATQRWDEDMVSTLPEYMRMLFIKTLHIFDEIEESVEPYGRYRMAYVKKERWEMMWECDMVEVDDILDIAKNVMDNCESLVTFLDGVGWPGYKLQTRNYLREAKWFNQNYTPTFQEQVDVSVMSTGLPLLFLLALTAMGPQVVTKEAFEWALNMPAMVCASAEVGRFLNDIASYKLGKNKMDVASSLECYMKEHDKTGEEAMVALTIMVEEAWRRINGACMEMDRAVMPTAQRLVDMTRMLEIYYLRGRDGLTFGRDLKEIVAFLFLKHIPV